MLKPGATVIDCGYSRVNGKVVGDVETNLAKSIVSHITPPIGGLGPVIIAELMRNTLKFYFLISIAFFFKVILQSNTNRAYLRNPNLEKETKQ